MIWNKPRNVWQWLLLFSPAVVAIGASQIFKWELPPVSPLRIGGGQGQEIPNVAGHLVRVLGIATDVILAGSAVGALILSRGPQLGQRIVNVFCFWVCLILANGFVAFAGCVATGAPKLTPDEQVPVQQEIGTPQIPASKSR